MARPGPRVIKRDLIAWRRRRWRRRRRRRRVY